MFQLSKEEYANLKSQFGPLDINEKGQYSKYLPCVFKSNVSICDKTDI